MLSTKVGRLIVDAKPVYDYSRDGTLRSVEESLARLGLDRIDLLLVHDIDTYTHGADQPARVREALAGALPVLSDLKAQGVIGGFGLGVNEWQVCAEVAAVMPLDAILLAGRYTLLEQGARGILDEALRRGIGIILGGPYNSGILPHRRAPGRALRLPARPARGVGTCRTHRGSTGPPRRSPAGCRPAVSAAPPRRGDRHPGPAGTGTGGPDPRAFHASHPRGRLGRPLRRRLDRFRPRRTPMKPPSDVFVGGAGSGGSVAAVRLSENPELSVLLLEAGPDFPDEASRLPLFVVSGAHTWRVSGAPELDWNLVNRDLAGRRGGRP